jgi:nucleoid DNA-binding protein
MRKRQWVGLTVLLGTLGLVLGLNEPAQSQRPPAKKAISLKDRIMDYSKLEEKDTNKFLQAIGPSVRDLLAAGQQVELPGLGLFRIVNVPAHRDLVDGRPATIPGSNYVEFVPSANLNGVANSPSATPAEVVPPFQYNPLPGRDPGMKAPNARMPNVRTR